MQEMMEACVSEVEKMMAGGFHWVPSDFSLNRLTLV